MYNSKYFCGASIISNTKLVTAAHCVFKIMNLQKLEVRAGSSLPHSGGQLRSVAKFIEHPKFNSVNLDNDVAVVFLMTPLTFSSAINVISLAKDSDYLPAGTMVEASGYGSTIPSENIPSDLHYTAMPIVDQKQCIKAYKKYEGKARVTDNMFCAGFYKVGGKDACQGDSGG